MKKLIVLIIALGTLNVWSAEFYVDSSNEQTIASILSLKLDREFSSNKHRCDDEPQDEDWVCNEEQTGRDSDLLGRGCKGDRSWACFTIFKETCTDRYSGRTHTRSYNNFDGCFATLSDCF